MAFKVLCLALLPCILVQAAPPQLRGPVSCGVGRPDCHSERPGNFNASKNSDGTEEQIISYTYKDGDDEITVIGTVIPLSSEKYTKLMEKSQATPILTIQNANFKLTKEMYLELYNKSMKMVPKHFNLKDSEHKTEEAMSYT